MDRAYIVTNKEQELDVLKKLEQDGFEWTDGDNPQEWFPSKEAFSKYHFEFPYTIITYEDDTIEWSYYSEDYKGNIVYDERKEEKMYKVTQEFMNDLTKWRDNYFLNAADGKSNHYLYHDDLDLLPAIAEDWRLENENVIERNNRLIAIIKWLNGEDVFEVEEPHKFIVRSDKKDREGDYIYVVVKRGTTNTSYFLSNATKFSSREKAQEWANSHQVVIEIDPEGNEVE